MIVVVVKLVVVVTRVVVIVLVVVCVVVVVVVVEAVVVPLIGSMSCLRPDFLGPHGMECRCNRVPFLIVGLYHEPEKKRMYYSLSRKRSVRSA